MEAAALFLSVRPRSIAETRRRLRFLGYRHDLVETVLGRLVTLGYLDDQAFARAWLESRDRARPRGTAALRGELAAKGIDRETVRVLLDERVDAAPDADEAAARRLLERRGAAVRREPDPVRRRQRAYALLARNGFAPDVCREVAGQLGHDEPDAELSGGDTTTADAPP